MVGKHHGGENGIKGRNGFWIRLLYIGYDTNFGYGQPATAGFEMLMVK
ncbi:MAG: hypothetical protein GY940_47550 [bacterium]|nr:hypothetical protein [bacterium]